MAYEKVTLEKYDTLTAELVNKMQDGIIAAESATGDLSGITSQINDIQTDVQEVSDKFTEQERMNWTVIEFLPYIYPSDPYSLSSSSVFGYDIDVTLPIPMDFKKYRYEFETEVYGLHKYNNSYGTNSAINCLEIWGNNEEVTLFRGDHASDTTKAKTEHLGFPHYIHAHSILSQDYTSLMQITTGYRNNEWVNRQTGVSPAGSSSVSTITSVTANFSGSTNSPIETYGVIFRYRAYAKK